MPARHVLDWKIEGDARSKAVYTGFCSRGMLFFFLFLSPFFPLCARVYRSPGFVWEKGRRDTFLITSREPRLGTSIFGHWHATSFFFLGSFYVFFIIITSFSRDFPAISSPSLDSESWKWKGVVHLFEINSVKFIFFKRKRDFIRNGIMNVSYL